MIRHTDMHLFTRTVRALLLATGLLLLASCGGSSDGGESSQPITQDDIDQDDISQDAGGQDPAAPIDAAAGDYVRTTSRPDLLSPTPATIDELVAGDGENVLVRYMNGAEPCAWARVTTTETNTTVEVLLETGLNPDAAAMSCIAQISAYEIEAQLTAPVGDRELIASSAGLLPPAVEDPLDGAVFPTDQYLGLTESEAMALGDVEQRVVRVARIDDENFMLTEDFRPSRVNIEIEAGVVVTATSG